MYSMSQVTPGHFPSELHTLNRGGYLFTAAFLHYRKEQEINLVVHQLEEQITKICPVYVCVCVLLR